MNNTENNNNLPTEKENSSPNLNVNSDNESDNIFERAISKASICIKYCFRWAYYTYIVKVDPKEKEAVEEILKELEEQNNKEKAIKITEDKIVNLHNELENVEINTQGNIGIKEKELKSKLEEKEELEKKLQEEYSGFASLFKGWFGQSKEKKEKLQVQKDKIDKEIKSLEREIEVIKNNLSEEKKQAIDNFNKKIEEQNKILEGLKKDKSGISVKISDKIKWLVTCYKKKSLKRTIFFSLLASCLITSFFYSTLFFNFLYKTYDKAANISSGDIKGGDVVVVISEQNEFKSIRSSDYDTVLEKAADYARKNNIPLLLAGVGNDLKNMKNTLSAWNFPTDKLMQIDSPASDLKDSVRKSADYLQAGQKFKEPVVFTDPLKIPRTRCEFYKKDMKSARFYNILNPDIGLNAKTIQDSYNYSSRTKSDIFKEASLYFFTADCRL